MRKRMNSLRLTSSNGGPPKASTEREMAVAEIRREVNGAMLGNTALELVPPYRVGHDVDRKRDGESDGKPDGEFRRNDRRPTEPTGRAPSLFFCYDVTSPFGEGLAT